MRPVNVSVRLLYPDPHPDPTSDPTPFFIDAKFYVKILFCRHYFSPLNTFMRKGKDPEPDPDPYI
jgi:hypothetical protein